MKISTAALDAEEKRRGGTAYYEKVSKRLRKATKAGAASFDSSRHPSAHRGGTDSALQDSTAEKTPEPHPEPRQEMQGRPTRGRQLPLVTPAVEKRKSLRSAVEDGVDAPMHTSSGLVQKAWWCFFCIATGHFGFTGDVAGYSIEG